MQNKSLLKIGIVLTLILTVINVVFSMENASAQTKITPIEYRVVTIPSNVSQPSLQSVLTLQGKSGWRYNNLIPGFNGNYLVFSKP